MRGIWLLFATLLWACGRYDVDLLTAPPDASRGTNDDASSDGAARAEANSAGDGPSGGGADANASRDDGSLAEGSLADGSGGAGSGSLADGSGGAESGSLADGSGRAESGAANEGGEAGLACVPPADRVCLSNGAACVVNPECCSSVCAGGFCMPNATCTPPGIPCASRDTCCSGRCEPTAVRGVDAGEGEGDGITRLECLNICEPDGATCRRALDCCSMSCHGGVCGGALCVLPDGGSSDDGTCQSDDSQSLCLETGDFCGANGARTCCSGVCSTTAGRCEFGPGPCLPAGAICTQNADCCRGTCAVNAFGVSVCTAPCLADGQSCALAADCCNGHCNGSPGTCSSTATVCNLIATSCAADVECCSGQCLGGACGSNCQVP